MKPAVRSPGRKACWSAFPPAPRLGPPLSWRNVPKIREKPSWRFCPTLETVIFPLPCLTSHKPTANGLLSPHIRFSQYFSNLDLFYNFILYVKPHCQEIPPALPGVFHMRAKPYVTSHASCGVGTACHLHRPSYPRRYQSVSFSFSYSCHP